MPTTNTEAASRQLFTQLKAGDRIQVNHLVTVGNKQWTSRTEGEVIRTERRRHGLHFRRNPDDKVYSDIIIFRTPDGSVTTTVMDEFTELKRV